jgi:two-component system sensor histidine kinase BaeS
MVLTLPQRRRRQPPDHNGLMKLRIVHQLSLLLIGAVLLSMLTVGGVVFWNLRSGFGEYLQARDDAQLDRFVQLVERKAAADPSFGWLRGSRQAMESLGDEFGEAEGFGGRRGQRPPPHPRPGGPRPPPPQDWAAAQGGPHPGDRLPPPLREPPPPPESGRFQDPEPGNRPPRGPDGILGRVQIFDLDGQWIAGRAQPQSQKTVSRAIKVEGREVGWVRLTREPQLRDVDASFLKRQYTGLLLAMAATLAVMLALAWWVAGRWSRPLRSLQQATRRMAQGELGVQVPPQGAREITGLIDDVNTLSSSLKKLESARRMWIAQISHELRTPLAVLRGEFEAIEDGARQPTPVVIASLREEVMQLIRLVSDLHTLSMADMGQLRCEFTHGDVASVVQRVARRFEARAAQSGLTLTVDPGPDMAVSWDFGRVEQLLGNLLENALRYTHAPGRVVISWRKAGPGARLVVEDSAPGVSAQDLAQLFEPLFRADSARARRGGEHGSGLGLSIAQAIVTAHQGGIWAKTSDLGGLAVTVDLPLMAH